MSSNDQERRGIHGSEEHGFFTAAVSPNAGTNKAPTSTHPTIGSERTSAHVAREGRRMHSGSTRPQIATREGEQQQRRLVGESLSTVPAGKPSGQVDSATGTTAPRTPHDQLYVKSKPSGASLVSPQPKHHAAVPVSVGREARHKAPAATATSGGSATVPEDAQEGMPVSSLSVTASNAARVLEGLTKDSDLGQHSKGDRNKVTDWGLYLPLCSNNPADAKAIHGRYIYSGNATADTWGGLKSMRPTSPFAAALEQPLSVTLRPAYKDTPRAARTAVSKDPVPTGGSNTRDSQKLHTSYAPPQSRNIAPTSAGQAMKTPVSYTPGAVTFTNPGHIRGGAQVPSYSAASGSGPSVTRTPLSSSSAARGSTKTVMTYQCRHCGHPPFIILNHARVHVENHYGPVNAGRVFVDEEHIKFIQQPVYD